MIHSACDIIIPVWNQPALTERCLKRVRAATDDPYRLILIDNGSDEPTRRLLERTQADDPTQVHLIRHPENLGFIKAVNQGIRVSTAPTVCLLNNDTVVTPGWLTAMRRVVERDPAIGLVNPASNTFGYRPAEATIAAIEAHSATLTQHHRGELQELPAAVGFCLLITRAVLEAVGLFDEQYGLGNFEDADFSKRALARGFRCVLTLDAYVYHEEKASFKHLPGWERAFRANQQAFERRWGRPLRILWERHGEATGDNHGWTPTMLEILRQGHWLLYSADNGLIADEVRRYATASPLAAGRGWRRRCLVYVLKRRKKPMDLVVTHDAILARCLRRLRRWHRAVILERPTPIEMEQQCQRLSHCP